VKTLTHNGCRITARIVRGKGPDWGSVRATVNGEPFPAVTRPTEDQVIADIAAQLDRIHAEPIDGDSWPAHYYPPGTYVLCGNGHPREANAYCRHSYCVREAAARTSHPDTAKEAPDA
jgi:hypothetical protein